MYINFFQLYIYIYIRNIYEMKIVKIFLLGLGFGGKHYHPTMVLHVTLNGNLHTRRFNT